jgi:hypothetical protein
VLAAVRWIPARWKSCQAVEVVKFRNNEATLVDSMTEQNIFIIPIG